MSTRGNPTRHGGQAQIAAGLASGVEANRPSKLRRGPLDTRVQNLRTELDARIGRFSSRMLQRNISDLLAKYPELNAALELHEMGKSAAPSAGRAELTEHSVATRSVASLRGLTAAQRQQRAVDAMSRLKTLSQWSLLHHPKLQPDGTVLLWHGAEGSPQHGDARIARYRNGTYRPGTSFTDKLTEAAAFSRYRAIIEASVPVRSVAAWYGMFPGSLMAEQGEYILDRGSLSSVRQLVLPYPTMTELGLAH